MNGARRVFVIVALVVAAALVIWLFGGCAMLKGRIKSGGVTVQSPKDGNGASLAQQHSGETLTLPEGTKVTTVKETASPAIPATSTTPAIPARPATETTTFVLPKEAVWQKDETRVEANTGTIDNTVAVRRIQAAENRYLLFAAIAAAGAGGFFLYIKYPTPAMMCGAASVVFFLAWKLADLPSWFYVVGVVAIAGGFALWRGHARGEADGVKAGLAGDVEPKNPPVVKAEP